MKSLLNTKFAAFILAISLFLFSCDKEEQFQEEIWAFNKEVTITDTDGNHQTAVLISSNEKNKIENFLENNRLTVALLHELPEMENNHQEVELDKELDQAPIDIDFYTEGPDNIDALGFTITVTPLNLNKSFLGEIHTYTSSKDACAVRRSHTNGTNDLPVSYQIKSKAKWYSTFVTRISGWVGTGIYSSPTERRVGSYRMRAKITDRNGWRYDIHFFN